MGASMLARFAAVEVTHISAHGFWLFVGETEFFPSLREVALFPRSQVPLGENTWV